MFRGLEVSSLTFSISATDKLAISRENHQSIVSNRQNVSHNVESSTA